MHVCYQCRGSYLSVPFKKTELGRTFCSDSCYRNATELNIEHKKPMVWVVTHEYDHDSSVIIGVFSSTEKAQSYINADPEDIRGDEPWERYSVTGLQVDAY